MALATYQVEAVGLTALLLSTQRSADPTDELVAKMAELTRIEGKKKTPEVHAEIARMQFILNLPWDSDHGVVIPAINMKNAIWDVSKEERKGPMALKYVTPTAEVFKLVYRGPQTYAELCADKSFYDTRLANHGSSMGKKTLVLQTRPVFKQWGFNSEFVVNLSKVSEGDFFHWIETVGMSAGIGAYRKIYGRFKTVVKRID